MPDDLPPIPDALRGLIFRDTWRVLCESSDDMEWSLRRGARARQTFYYRVINSRGRWIARHYPHQDRYRVWHITAFHPGGDYADHGREIHPPERCTPTLLTRQDEKDRSHYRAACLACTWEGPEHTGTRRTVINRPIEEAHDHAFPGWRDLPHAPAAAVDEPHGPAWQHLATLYPPGWLTAGAPILQRRTSPHDQHLYPWGPRNGYLFRLPAPARKAPAAPTQTPRLF